MMKRHWGTQINCAGRQIRQFGGPSHARDILRSYKSFPGYPRSMYCKPKPVEGKEDVWAKNNRDKAVNWHFWMKRPSEKPEAFDDEYD